MPSRHIQHIATLRLDSERRLAMLVTSLMLLPNVLFAVADAALVPDAATRRTLYILRASQLALWGVSIVLIRRARSRAALYRLLFALATAVVIFVLGVSWLRPSDNFFPLRTLIVLSMGVFVALPYRFRNQLISWLVLTAGTLALLWGHYPTMTAVDRFSFLTNYGLAGLLGLLVSRSRVQLERDFDEALAREAAAIEAREAATSDLKRLQGIIPICAYCHQVRNDAGAWEQLDQYVRTHSDADFSHGMCPACAKANFGELMEPPSDPH